MTTPRTCTALLLIVSALALAVPGTAAAARSCPPAEDHPVYGLSVMNGARCGAAAVIAHRLARRFDSPSDLARGVSRHPIYQYDARGRRWKCQWNSASAHNDVVNWNCVRLRRNLVSWIWREHRL